MKRQRRVLRWWMPQNCAPTGTSCSTHRIRVERLEERNYLASDLAEESTVSSHWKEDATIEATDNYVDVAYANQNQADGDSKEQVLDNEPVTEGIEGTQGISDTENYAGVDAAIDIRDMTDTEESVDTEETIDTESLKEVEVKDQAEATDDENNEDESEESEESEVDLNDEKPAAVDKPTNESSDEVLSADDYTVEWIDDSTTESDTDESSCPIDPETGYESFCQGNEVPGKTRPDRNVDSPNSADAENNPPEAESIKEIIPTIASSRRELILSTPAPIVELGRPQLYALPQLTINPHTTIDRTEAVRLKITSQDKADFANATKVIEAGSSGSRLASKPSAADVKNLADTEKPSAKPLSEASNFRLQPSKWRRSIESLRPLISQIPWISPLLKRSSSDTEKDKAEDAGEPGTVGMQTRDLSPSDKPMRSNKEPSHTKSNATGEQSPISSRGTQSMDLPAQATRNNENAPDSKSTGHPIEETSPSNRHLGLFFPALIGLTLGKNSGWFAKKERNKPVSKRPLPIDNDPTRTVSNG